MGEDIWVYFQRPESGNVMGYNIMGFIVSPRYERIFTTDICEQMVANVGVKLSLSNMLHEHFSPERFKFLENSPQALENRLYSETSFKTILTVFFL